MRQKLYHQIYLIHFGCFSQGQNMVYSEASISITSPTLSGNRYQSTGKTWYVCMKGEECSGCEWGCYVCAAVGLGYFLMYCAAVFPLRIFWPSQNDHKRIDLTRSKKRQRRRAPSGAHCGRFVLLLFGQQFKNPLFNLQQSHCSALNWHCSASKSRHRALEETLLCRWVQCLYCMWKENIQMYIAIFLYIIVIKLKS